MKWHARHSCERRNTAIVSQRNGAVLNNYAHRMPANVEMMVLTAWILF